MSMSAVGQVAAQQVLDASRDRRALMCQAARAVRVQERGARAWCDTRHLGGRRAVARVEASLAALEPRVVEIHEQSELCEAAVGEAVALVDVAAEALAGPVLVQAHVGVARHELAPAQLRRRPRAQALQQSVGHIDRQDGQPAVVAVGDVRCLSMLLELERGGLAPRDPGGAPARVSEYVST